MSERSGLWPLTASCYRTCVLWRVFKVDAVIHLLQPDQTERSSLFFWNENTTQYYVLIKRRITRLKNNKTQRQVFAILNCKKRIIWWHGCSCKITAFDLDEIALSKRFFLFKSVAMFVGAVKTTVVEFTNPSRHRLSTITNYTRDRRGDAPNAMWPRAWALQTTCHFTSQMLGRAKQTVPLSQLRYSITVTFGVFKKIFWRLFTLLKPVSVAAVTSGS